MNKLFAMVSAADLEPRSVEGKLTALRARPAASGAPTLSGSVSVLTLEPFSGTLVAPAGDLGSPSGCVMIECDASNSASGKEIVAWCQSVWPDAILLASHRHEPDGAVAVPDPVVRIGFITRQPHLSPEVFREHWLNVHVPLVMTSDPLFFQYVTNIADGAPEWDGLVEQWFADAGTWEEHDRRILEERPKVRADIPNFVHRLDQYVGKPAFRLAF